MQPIRFVHCARAGARSGFLPTSKGGNGVAAGQLTPSEASKILCLKIFFLVKGEQFARMGVGYGDRGFATETRLVLGAKGSAREQRH